MSILTTVLFWDCNCMENYINHKQIEHCEYCGALAMDSPDSHLGEVLTQVDLTGQDLVDLGQELIEIGRSMGGRIKSKPAKHAPGIAVAEYRYSSKRGKHDGALNRYHLVTERDPNKTACGARLASRRDGRVTKRISDLSPEAKLCGTCFPNGLDKNL